MNAADTVMDTLKTTSRTFFLSICRLPPGLQEAIASAYLCMRAIDEIEDHAQLSRRIKVRQLQAIGQLLQAPSEIDSFPSAAFTRIFADQSELMPAVTLGLADWACYAPQAIAPRIWDATSAMASRMAYWVANGWKIETEADLDRYTFSVAGSVGLLICDLWAWFHGEQLSRTHALHFGRGLQAVNILRNRAEDLARGVDFFPTGWTAEQVHTYASQHLSTAETYADTLDHESIAYLIKLPLRLAYATLDTLALGEQKLDRSTVLQVVQQINEA